MGAISAALLLGALVTTACGMYRSCLLVLDHVHLSRSILRSSGRRALERVYGRMLASTPISRMLGGYRHRKRVEALEQGMPEVLRLLCTALESGSSLVMALRYAADNCSEPLAGELKRTVWDLEAGQGFDEALEKLRQRTGGSEFAYLAVAMEIQHQSGGSLTDTLESVAGLLQQTAELKDDLRTKTAQGRLSSRIVTIMPFALLAILSVFSPGYLTGFLSSPLGVCLFVLALLFEAAGIVLVRRALAVDFSVDLEEAV